MPFAPRFLIGCSCASALLTVIPVAAAQETAFTDMKTTDFGYEAAIYLKEKNIMKGYKDGSFKPDGLVNRAEAIKIIAEPLIKPSEQNSLKGNGYKDVPNDAWFSPHVEWARMKKVIKGPAESSSFFPTRAVTKAEFLKMLLLAYGADPNSFGEVQIPLAPDVSNPKEWYYPFMRYAISASMQLVPASGKFQPQRELTRADVAVILHRFLEYRLGRRNQALLDETTEEVVKVLDAMEKNDLRSAEYASGRALLAARGAHASMPNEVPIKVAVKTAEAIRALVRAYKAGLDNDLNAVVKHSQDAWYLADQARVIAPEAGMLSKQIQTYANNFAASARKQKK